MTNKGLLVVLVIVIGCLLLAGCGQKGKLVLATSPAAAPVVKPLAKPVESTNEITSESETDSSIPKESIKP